MPSPPPALQPLKQIEEAQTAGVHLQQQLLQQVQQQQQLLLLLQRQQQREKGMRGD